MKHVENYFKDTKNRKIYYQVWLPEETPKAIVLIIHGLAEHSGRYSEVASELNNDRYAVYGLDHIGHGKSEGRRVFIENFQDYLKNINQFFEIIRSSNNKLPIFILGHSMGGLIVANYLLEYQSDLSGAILSSPALKPPKNISKTTILLGNILSAIAPKLGVMKLNSAHISTNQSITNSYKEDPLVHKGKVSARLSTEMLKAMKHVETNAEIIKLPIMIMQGSNDKIVDPDGAKAFYNYTCSKDKMLKIYEGLYHEILNEPDNKEIIKDLNSWLNRHC